MKKQVKVKEIQKILDKKYPNPPVIRTLNRDLREQV